MNKQYRIEEIKQEIKSYERKIEEAKEQIRKHNQEADELDDMYRKYARIADQVGEFSYKQQMQAQTLETNFQNVRFSKKLANNIQDELNSTTTRNAINKTEQIMQKMQVESRAAGDKIQELQHSINRYNQEINDLEHELSRLKYQM